MIELFMMCEMTLFIFAHNYLIYILFTRGCFIGKPKAAVSIQPDPHVYFGEIVTLRCYIQGGGDTEWTYSWHKNNNSLDSEEFTDNAMQEFSIWPASDSDIGDYTCRGQSNDSQSSVMLLL